MQPLASASTRDPDFDAGPISLEGRLRACGRMDTGLTDLATSTDSLVASLLAVLDRMPCGVLVLGPSGEILGANRAADSMLDLAAGADHRARRDALKALLAAARAKLDPSDDLFVTVRREPRPPLILHAAPIGASGASAPHMVVTLLEPTQSPQPTAKVLRRLFDLTPAETRLAQAIGCGQTLAEVSRATGLSSATLRTQLASIFVKTQTKRQAELVALLAKTAILP